MNSGLHPDAFEEILRYEDFSTIDWIQDSILERNRRLRTARTFDTPLLGHGQRFSLRWLWAKLRKAVDAGQSWFVVGLVGICIGVTAAIISIVTEWLSDMKMGYCGDGWWLNQQFCCWEIEDDEAEGCDSWHPWSDTSIIRWSIYVLFAALFSFISAHMVKNMAKYAAGSGISEIKCILAGFVMEGFLGFATFAIKALTLPLVIASGLSVGKEGPSVHFACCIGALVAGWFAKFSRSQSKMREVITAASAAGVAVAFGSPIGGVLFSIEAMNPFRTGKLVLFQVTYDRDWHFFEIIFFVILGIFGGLYGAFVIKFNLQANHGVAEAVLLATITAMIGYSNRFLRIDMTESMAVLFHECEGRQRWRLANSLLLATAIRCLLVIVSYGCKVPAGIFVPSMAIGASFGRMVGIMVKAMYQSLPFISLFIFYFSGIMRITVTVVVIMFELTGALTYILPTMIVLLVTKGVGDMLGTNGIADEMIRFNGFPFLEKDDHAYNVAVSSVMRTELETLKDQGLTVGQVEEVLASTDVKGFPIVADGASRDDEHSGSKILVGYVGRTELRWVLDRARTTENVEEHTTTCRFSSDPDRREDMVDDMQDGGLVDDLPRAILGSEENTIKIWPWVNQTPMTVSPHLPLEIVMQLFKRMGPRVILVEERGALVGLVTVKDVLRFIATEKLDHDLTWDERGGLDAILSELWRAVSSVFDGARSFFRR
ncbi:Cl-channel protein [Flagelloscypha sp. PMI_526]|nr:Cl-channel protein [Flagelloscypha sp. PMI_526]